MKTVKYAMAICAALALAGCTITGHMNRRQLNAGLSYAPRPQVAPVVERDTAPPPVKTIVFTDINGKTHHIVPVETRASGERIPVIASGERIPVIAIDEVVVKVRRQSRTLPERNGKVLIDFVITLPKQLQGNCQSIAVTPVLHNLGRTELLEPLTIRGELFSKVQDRNYWQYEQYCALFKPDLMGKERAFQRFVRNPYPQGARLDSIVERREAIEYYYTQEVPTRDAGKQLRVTLEGRVAALDRSSYRLPPSDTLRYNISSMLAFVDTTQRFITRVVEKYAVVKDRNYLNFHVNRTEIVDSLSDNRTQLARIEGLMERLVNQQEFYVDSIILTASASPEGSVRHNDALARGRAFALRDCLAAKFKGGGVGAGNGDGGKEAGIGGSAKRDGNGRNGTYGDGGSGAVSEAGNTGKTGGNVIADLISVRWVGEDWEELARLIRGGSLPNREPILDMMAGAGVGESLRCEDASPKQSGSLTSGLLRSARNDDTRLLRRSSSPSKPNLDALERQIRERYPADYRAMLENIYPLLRAVTFKYDLRRVGMVNDTIHTTVPDTLYRRGYELLNDRRYAEALHILRDYRDRNAAICLLSLGLDTEVLALLSSFPRTAVNEYLTAIACARLSRREEGLEHFETACRLDPRMRYRGALDPEITLLKEK